MDPFLLGLVGLVVSGVVGAAGLLSRASQRERMRLGRAAAEACHLTDLQESWSFAGTEHSLNQ
jgi:hypothetical protein